MVSPRAESSIGRMSDVPGGAGPTHAMGQTGSGWPFPQAETRYEADGCFGFIAKGQETLGSGFGWIQVAERTCLLNLRFCIDIGGLCDAGRGRVAILTKPRIE